MLPHYWQMPFNDKVLRKISLKSTQHFSFSKSTWKSPSRSKYTVQFYKMLLNVAGFPLGHLGQTWSPAGNPPHCFIIPSRIIGRTQISLATSQRLLLLESKCAVHICAAFEYKRMLAPVLRIMSNQQTLHPSITQDRKMQTIWKFFSQDLRNDLKCLQLH